MLTALLLPAFDLDLPNVNINVSIVTGASEGGHREASRDTSEYH